MLTAVGLALLAVDDARRRTARNSSFSLAPMIAFEAGLFFIGGLLILGPRAGAPAEHHGVMLAAAAGILFGVCNVAVKALTGLVGDDGMLGPRLALAARGCVAGSFVAFYASARSLQDGDAVEVIAITGTAANISCIAGGIIVFGDPMPGDTLGIVVQSHRLRPGHRRLGADARAAPHRRTRPRRRAASAAPPRSRQNPSIRARVGRDQRGTREQHRATSSGSS